MMASVVGDAWRWAILLVVAPLVLGLWYLILSGFGATSGGAKPADRFRGHATNLADPRFRGLHRFIKWSAIVCMLALIAECTFILPYVVLRFGWSG